MYIVNLVAQNWRIWYRDIFSKLLKNYFFLFAYMGYYIKTIKQNEDNIFVGEKNRFIWPHKTRFDKP